MVEVNRAAGDGVMNHSNRALALARSAEIARTNHGKCRDHFQ